MVPKERSRRFLIFIGALLGLTCGLVAGWGHGSPAVGVAGPEHAAMMLREIDQGTGQRQCSGVDLEQLILEEEPEIASHLIVAGPAGVQPLAGAGSPAGEPVLDRGMHVLVPVVEFEAAS